MKELEKLLAIKKVIELDEDDRYYIHTINRETLWEGCATFLNNGKDMIRVYEGTDTGKDDKNISYEEFINKYSYTIRPQ